MEWIIFIILCLLLWLLPLPFGGNVEWAVLVLEVTVWVLFLAYIAILSRSKSEVGARARSPVERAVLWLAILFFLVAGLQLIPLPESFIGTISPVARSWRQSLVAAGLFGPNAFRAQTFSLSPWVSLYELIRYLTYGAFVFLLARTLNSRTRITVLTLTLISAGVFQSLYGLSEFFGGTNRIFTWVNKYYSGSAFGTFVNRDHYSAFLEMLFPLSLGYFLVRSEFFSLRPGLSWRQKLARFGQEHVQKSLLFIIPPLIIGLGLFFSRCRSGIIIFIITFFVSLILLSVSAGSGKRVTEKKLVRVVVLVVLLAVILVGIDPILVSSAVIITGQEGWRADQEEIFRSYRPGVIGIDHIVSYRIRGIANLGEANDLAHHPLFMLPLCKWLHNIVKVVMGYYEIASPFLGK